MPLSFLPDAALLPLLLGLALGLGWVLARPMRLLAVHSWAERLLLWAILGVVAFSWIGTLLAALDLFLWPVMCGVLALVVLAVWIYRKHLVSALASTNAPDSLLEPVSAVPSPGATPVLAILLVLVVLGAAAWLYARPAESFFLVDDSAVYTIGGVLLARTGSLVARPEVFWQATEDFVHQFMAVDPFLLVSRHYGPFYQWTAGQTSVEIGFLPLPKVWMALTTWLWGAARATWATPWFGVLGLAALYGLVRRQIGWLAGLITILLLAVSLPQLWFARYPLSEVYTQTFLLAGLYLAVLARQNAATPPLARWLAFWSALTLAGLTLLRFEAILLLALLVFFLLLGWRRTVPELRFFVRPWLLTLALASGYGVAIAVGLTRRYFLAQSLAVLPPDKVRIGLIALGVLSLVGVWLWPQRVRLYAQIIRLSRWLPGVYFGILAAWMALAAWQLLTRDQGESLSSWLVQYWTPSGVALGAAGAAWLVYEELRQPRRPEVLALIGLGLALLIGYGIYPAVNPVHPWAVRRLVPVALPVLALGVGALLAAGLEPLRRWFAKTASFRPWQWGLIGITLAVLAVQYFAIWRVGWPVWPHRELAGFYSQVENIAQQLPPDAVLLFDNGQVGERLTQVFEFVFQRPALSIRATPVSSADSEVDTLIEAARAQGRRVFFVVTDGDLSWWPERWRLESQSASEIAIPLLRPVRGRPPDATDIVTRSLWLDIYEVLPAGAMPQPDQPQSLPVGPGSYPYYRAGFERWSLDASGSPIRWTKGNARLLVPWPSDADEAPVDVCLILRVAGGRPVDSKQAELTVEVEGETVFSGELTPGFDVQTFMIPANDLQDRDESGLAIDLLSDTWNPNGERALGVLVHGVEIADGARCEP